MTVTALKEPVVLGWDGSSGAALALDVVARLLPTAPVLVVTVWEPTADTVALDPVDDLVGSASGLYRQLDQIGGQIATKTSAEGARRADALGLAAKALTVRGQAAAAIVAIAEEHDARLVVVAGHRHGGLRGGLLGGTASALLRHSPRPVLIVPLHAPAG